MLFFLSYHEYVPLVVNTSRSFPHSRLVTGFVTRLTRRVSVVEQELLTLPENLRSPPDSSGVNVTRCLVLYVCFVDRCLYFFFWALCCLFFFDIRILITPLVSSNSSSITLVIKKIKYAYYFRDRRTSIFCPSLYRFGIFKRYFDSSLMLSSTYFSILISVFTSVFIENDIVGVIANVLTSSPVDRRLQPRLGQTKDYTICICCFSTKHAALRRKSKDWLARNQDNVSEWGDMCISWMLFQWARTIKIQLNVLVWHKAYLIIMSFKINLFSLWYSWKIAALALNSNHSLTIIIDKYVILTTTLFLKAIMLLFLKTTITLVT